MNKHLRFTVVAFILLAMLLVVFPASARAVKTQVTGTFYFYGEPGEDPRFREWVSGSFPFAHFYGGF